MTTVTLSDGTVVPKHYDFNQHFPPLPVHNQGANPICWYETRATMIEAFMRMYDQQSVHLNANKLSYSDEGWAVSHWTDLRDNGFGALGTMTYYGGDHVTNLPEYKDLPFEQALAKALWLNGILEGVVKCEHSFARMWKHPEKYGGWHAKKGFTHIPTLHTLKGDLEAIKKNTWAHSVIYTGYRLAVADNQIISIEILCPNSWGKNFGMNGRVYIGQDLIRDGAADPGFIYTWNDHPVNSLVMPKRSAT